jgi:murein DD-endopeptidase MepM/ murein hydrolase activator NlpD
VIEGEAASPTVHRVQRGETLSSIANRYGVSVDDFVRANDLADPDLLTVGQPLIIPAGSRGGSWSWPVAGGEILSGFGTDRGIEVHRGVDIRADAGQPVVAAWAGVVVYSGSDMRDYGNAVILDHGGGLTSLYGHNAELLVSAGDRVGRGDPIALAGSSGNATTVHCHFEVRKNAVAIDPLELLGSRR